MGYPDKVIEQLSGCEIAHPAVRRLTKWWIPAPPNSRRRPLISTLPTTRKTRLLEFIGARRSQAERRVIVFGSGPIRIGQGIEFDYASVHCVWALKKAGYEVVIVNNNPETVSTDFDTADRLYFEPLTPEDVMGVIHTEKPYRRGCGLRRTDRHQADQVPGRPRESTSWAPPLTASIWRRTGSGSTSCWRSMHIKRPEGYTVMTTEEALEVANRIGYPVLMRPSYVLGGQNMIIAFTDDGYQGIYGASSCRTRSRTPF